MQMNYFIQLIHSKGLGQLAYRGLAISRRYGVTPGRMMRAFDQFLGILEQYGCRATFPVTAVTLARHPAPFHRLQERGMELAIHGWTHVNLERYSLEQQREHISRAIDTFARYGISAVGFRSPYLRHNGAIREAAEVMGFRYMSNQPVLWDAVDLSAQPQERLQAYQRAIGFYKPWSSAKHPSLPLVRGEIIEIPVSLPDDEMLVERLKAGSAQIAEVWTRILYQTYARGELFALQLHPERAELCAPALSRVLSEARALSPPVWIACLYEVAEWWKQRRMVRVDVERRDQSRYDIVIHGPTQVSALVRSAHVMGKSETWGNGYQLVRAHHFSVSSDSRPFIGVSVRTSRSLVDFLQQQGYLVETSEREAEYSVYLDFPEFSEGEGKGLLEEIEAAQSPLVRINPWPGNVRSALAITGDIDALTLWDYGSRLVGR